MAHVESTCLLDDSGTPKDFTYCVAFNKDLLACWDPESGQIVPIEFGVLYNLAVFISKSLNTNEALIRRLGKGLQDCAMHTQPFWDALTHRTSEQRGCRGAVGKHGQEGRADVGSGRLPVEGNCVEQKMGGVKGGS